VVDGVLLSLFHFGLVAFDVGFDGVLLGPGHGVAGSGGVVGSCLGGSTLNPVAALILLLPGSMTDHGVLLFSPSPSCASSVLPLLLLFFPLSALPFPGGGAQRKEPEGC
jgi:hypothetical protein